MVDSSVVEQVERAVNGNSQQGRFKDKRALWHWMVQRMVASAAVTPPEYQADSKRRDAWLRQYARQEPFLGGIVSNVVQIDKNRGWSLTGGRNQVLNSLRILRDADQGHGWRWFCGRLAEDFYQTDMGGMAETGAEGVRGGPLAALWNVDSAVCKLTGKINYPLQFEEKEWHVDEFFRVVSSPSADQKLNGLGFSPVSRALELSKIMIGMIHHSQEKLATRLAQGFMSVGPISELEWEQLEKDAKAELDNGGNKAFGGVRILRWEDDKIEVDLTSLSQLPDHFALDAWVQVMMSGMSLIFGYDISEFYSPRSGGFSRGAESEVQAAKASGKGEKDFVFQTQEQLNERLPAAVQFEFHERDERAEFVQAEIHEKQAKIAQILYTSKASMEDAEGILNKAQIQSYLASQGVIPKEWTEIEEIFTMTDTGMERARLREMDFIHRAAQYTPHDPIVRAHWPSGKVETLWDRAEDATRRKSFPGVTLDSVSQRVIQRLQQRATLYDKVDVEITDDDVDKAIDEILTEFPEGDIAALLTAEEKDNAAA